MPGWVCSKKIKPGSPGSQDPSPESSRTGRTPVWCPHGTMTANIIVYHCVTCSRCSLGHVSTIQITTDLRTSTEEGSIHTCCSLSYSYEERAGSQRNGLVDGCLSGNMLTTLLCFFPMHKPFSYLHPEVKGSTTVSPLVTVSAQHPYLPFSHDAKHSIYLFYFF